MRAATWLAQRSAPNWLERGGLAVDSTLGWKGTEAYVAPLLQVCDLWQGSQERYDILMNNYTERTWVLITSGDAIKQLMKTCVKYPAEPSPRQGQTSALAIQPSGVVVNFNRTIAVECRLGLPLRPSSTSALKGFEKA